MENTKVKKTWVSVGEKETLIELVNRCENKEFVKFIKEHPLECFPAMYFEHFCWIKFRFDDLKFDFENGNDPLANTKTYFGKKSQDHFDDDEDCLDLSDWDISNGRLIGSDENISIERKDDEFLESVKLQHSIMNNRKVTQSEIIKEKTNHKDLEIVIDSYEQLIPAMKCLLWSMNNEPQTTKKLYSFIKMNDNGNIRPLDRNDYDSINPLIKDASKNGLLCLEKPSKDVFLYRNNTDYRKGYFYRGKLCSIAELVSISGIPKSTLADRLKKMNTAKAMQK